MPGLWFISCMLTDVEKCVLTSAELGVTVDQSGKTQGKSQSIRMMTAAQQGGQRMLLDQSQYVRHGEHDHVMNQEHEDRYEN